MIELILMISLTPVLDGAPVRTAQFETCSLPNQCAPVAKVEIETCGLPNSCAPVTTAKADDDMGICVWPNPCTGAEKAAPVVAKFTICQWPKPCGSSGEMTELKI